MSAEKVKDDFWHLDGRHRGSARTSNGRDVTKFENGIRAHIEECVKLPRETTDADDK